MIKISNEELELELLGKKKEFPKYLSPILNLANRFAQATRPEVVGQMTELIKQCPHKTYEEWKKWYLTNNPNAINNATTKIMNMLTNFKNVISKVDERVVREWVEDLVLVKTFIGLRFQEVILKRIASLTGKKYRMATPEEESKGIDGFIDGVPVSIKPITYKLEKGRLIEKIKGKVIYYKKVEDGIEFDASEILTEK
jgi:hypothetical protein